MKKAALIVFMMITLLFVNDASMNNLWFEQPEALYIDSNTYIQPILENEDSAIEYRFIRTLKVYYKDPMTKPLYLKDGTPLSSYCSDQTKLELITFRNDTISQISTRRMSCQILAIINLTEDDIFYLKNTRVKEIIITNMVTDNRYSYFINTDYFQKTLKY